MKQAFVVDCSAVAAALLSESDGQAMDNLLEKAAAGRIELIVPALFWFEVLNVLVLAERRRRINKGEAQRLLALLLTLPIQTDDAPSRLVLQRIGRIAEKHALTAYDAAYVELAERIGARLKTLDKEVLRLATSYSWIS